MIVFYRTTFSIGGVETLINRMSEWFLLKNERVCLVVKTFDKNCYSTVINPLITMGVNFVVYKKQIYKFLKYEMKKDRKNYLFTFATIQPDAYIFARRLMRTVSEVDYMNIPLDILKFPYYRLDFFLQGILLRKNFIWLAQNAKNVYLDDYVSLEQFFKFKIDARFKLQLPMKLFSFDKEKCRHRYNKNEKIILAIARADFPFKGYLIGLLEKFTIWCKYDDKLRLVIISYGKDYDRLCEEKNKFNGFGYKISILNNVAYKDIHKYYLDAYVYIGMGTSLLDAANESLVAIPVEINTYKLRSNDFWCNTNLALGSLGNADNIDEMMKYVLSCEENEYVDLSRKTYNKLVENFDINIIMNKIIDCCNYNKKINLNYSGLLISSILVNIKDAIKLMCKTLLAFRR